MSAIDVDTDLPAVTGMPGARPTTRKVGADLQVGDLIVFLGQTHRIGSFEPYRHPKGAFGRRAICEAGWWMITYDGDLIEVAL